MSKTYKSIEDVSSADLATIKNRLIIEGVIKLTTQMHIGIGDSDINFSPESAILRTSLNLPYIPSSTIKGNFRAAVEAFAKSLGNKQSKKEYICEEYPKKYCTVEQEKEVFKDPCVVCSIFGGNDLASHIIISDAFLVEDTIKELHSGLKPGIAIDREKQVSRDGSLFFIETLQPGAKFEFKIIINNITQETKQKEFELLQTLFHMINIGLVSFGGKRSTGMGRFVLENTTVKELKSKEDFLFSDDVEAKNYMDYFKLK